MTLVFVEHCGQPTHRKLAQCQHDSVDSSAVGAGCRRISLSDVFVKPSKRQCAHENIFSHYRQHLGKVQEALAQTLPQTFTLIVSTIVCYSTLTYTIIIIHISMYIFIIIYIIAQYYYYLFTFQNPLLLYHILHQMSTVISNLTKNYISETYHPTRLYSYTRIIFLKSYYFLHAQPTLFLCVYPRKQDSCVRRMRGYVQSAPAFSCVPVCIFLKSWAFYVCTPKAGLKIYVTYWDCGFIIPEYYYYILGYRVYRL